MGCLALSYHEQALPKKSGRSVFLSTAKAAQRCPQGNEKSCAGSYKFGFNGQEKVNEIAGIGNHTTALFWEYDTRIARRWNTDPRPNSSVSPYAVFNGNPILFSDYLGDTVKIEGSKSFVKRTMKSLGRIRGTDEGLKLYEKLHGSTNIYTIREYSKNATKVENGDALPENWKVGDIGITGKRESEGFDMGKGGWLALGHEMSHAADVEDRIVSNDTWQTPDKTFSYEPVVQGRDGTFSFGNTATLNVPPLLIDEVRAVDRENKMRSQAGISLRTHYNNVFVNTANVPDGKPFILKIPMQKLVEKGVGLHPQYNTDYNLLKKK